MLHHYTTFNNPLSQFLSFHQVEEGGGEQIAVAAAAAAAASTPNSHPLYESACRSTSSPALSSPGNKSFTIAAILGLKGGEKHPEVTSDPTDLSTTVVNLSVHPGSNGGCTRLQFPVRHHPPPGSWGHHGGHSVATSCASKQSVKGVKHLQPSIMNKKPCKSKRVRTIFTPEQLERLEAEFERQQYMVGPERLYLAHTLQLTEAQVKVWFQNRRIKWRKHHLEITHQRLAAIKQQQLLLSESHIDIQDTNSSSSTDNT